MDHDAGYPAPRGASSPRIGRELDVPVVRVDARLLTDDGQSHQVTVFLPPGEGLGHLLEGGSTFIPVSEEGRIRLRARATIVATAPRRQGSARPPRPCDELLTEARALRVTLRGGAVLEGTLRFHARPGHARTADLLNESAATFTLDVDGAEYAIAKAHVTCVDEV